MFFFVAFVVAVFVANGDEQQKITAEGGRGQSKSGEQVSAEDHDSMESELLQRRSTVRKGDT